jgi:hypothetical protein
MTDPTSTALKERVLNNFNSIDRVLKFFLTLAALTCLLKLTNQLTLSLNGVAVPTKWAWAVSVAFTVAHLFTTWRFQQSARLLLSLSNATDRQNLFDRITSSGGPWVRNLIPRRKKRYVYRMKWRDPSTIVSYGAVVVMVIAIVQFDFNNPSRTIKYAVVALAIVIVNWLIGARWAVTLSDFAVDSQQAAVAVKKPDAPVSL